jgi:NAD(P)-dependent dehydrogenase (short-subunit alcohol dehydrogenase family)
MKIALVAGATRGAGRGIAVALGEAGYTVYCSGRSTRAHAATPGRSENIEDTADMVTARGGKGIAVQTDHRDVGQVRALIDRIRSEQGRLDLLVNDIWGGDAWNDWWWKISNFWKIPLEKGFEVINTAVNTHIITAHEAIPLMIDSNGGMIVEITDGDGYYYRGQFYYDFVKTTTIRMALAWAHELRKQKIASVAITPGFLRSESVMQIMGVTEANWRDGAKKYPEFAESETPMFVGRAIAALAADPDRMKKSGRVFNSYELACEYGVTDVDGRVPNVWSLIAGKYGHKKLDDVFYSYCGFDVEEMEKLIAEIGEDVDSNLSVVREL